MIGYTQLQTDDCGDCLASSIECILELPLGTLPRPVDGELDTEDRWLGYRERLRAALRPLNAWLVEISGRDEVGAPLTPPGWAVGGFAKPAVLPDGRLHALVCKDGDPVHDTHPGLRRLVGLHEWGRAQCWDLLTPIDPQRPVGRP